MVPEVRLWPAHLQTKERQMSIFRRFFEVIVTPEDGQAILSCDYWTPDTEFPGAFVSCDPALSTSGYHQIGRDASTATEGR